MTGRCNTAGVAVKLASNRFCGSHFDSNPTINWFGAFFVARLPLRLQYLTTWMEPVRISAGRHGALRALLPDGSECTLLRQDVLRSSVLCDARSAASSGGCLLLRMPPGCLQAWLLALGARDGQSCSIYNLIMSLKVRLQLAYPVCILEHIGMPTHASPPQSTL